MPDVRNFKLPERMSDEDKRPILSVSDALDWVADILANRATNQGLMAMLGSVMSRRELDDDKSIPEVVREVVKASMIEPEKQVTAMRETVRILRELSVEHRVLQMRELDRLREKNDAR